jgi:hypothetical protein
LLLKSAFERIFNVMQLILVKIKWHIKWKYIIQKFHDICLSYCFKYHFTLVLDLLSEIHFKCGNIDTKSYFVYIKIIFHLFHLKDKIDKYIYLLMLHYLFIL